MTCCPWSRKSKAALRAAHSGYAAEADYGQTGNPYTQVQAASDRLAALSAWRAWRAYPVVPGGSLRTAGSPRGALSP